MREVTYTDTKGRKRVALLPDGAPDSDAQMGIPIGPPPLDSLGLPQEIEVRLHNQLFERRLIRKDDLRGRRQDVVSALQAALRLDVQKIVDIYLNGG